MGFSPLFSKSVFIDFESFLWGSEKILELPKHFVSVGICNIYFSQKNFDIFLVITKLLPLT